MLLPHSAPRGRAVERQVPRGRHYPQRPLRGSGEVRHSTRASYGVSVCVCVCVRTCACACLRACVRRGHLLSFGAHTHPIVYDDVCRKTGKFAGADTCANPSGLSTSCGNPSYAYFSCGNVLINGTEPVASLAAFYNAFTGFSANANSRYVGRNRRVLCRRLGLCFRPRGQLLLLVFLRNDALARTHAHTPAHTHTHTHTPTHAHTHTHSHTHSHTHTLQGRVPEGRVLLAVCAGRRWSLRLAAPRLPIRRAAPAATATAPTTTIRPTPRTTTPRLRSALQAVRRCCRGSHSRRTGTRRRAECCLRCCSPRSAS